jgi:hypothetical protein
MPQNEGEVLILFALFREVKEGSLSRFGIQEVYDENVDIVLVVGDGEAGIEAVGKGNRVIDELRDLWVRSRVCDGCSDG